MMALKEAFLLDLGWLFFAGWIAVILGASWLAFGNDLKKAAERRSSLKLQ